MSFVFRGLSFWYFAEREGSSPAARTINLLKIQRKTAFGVKMGVYPTVFPILGELDACYESWAHSIISGVLSLRTSGFGWVEARSRIP
ncbi:hypothetical protein GCM10007870_24810 [Gluconobacter kondonii]|uniref:Uncharacterized protein n=1 Tax=Gluconobacter kondonii TaxID=941463 RepID=A0ABQ5WTK7_9PROT|nr:hypothetical protein GCM10007870_24810 [Gluconobacter kondonii]